MLSDASIVGVLYRSLKYDSDDYHMVGSLSYSILVVYS